jgi:hypothetical protein
MAEESTDMKMFIMDLKYSVPAIFEREVTVKVCKQTVWAIRPNGKRHLVGASAFQTLASAKRAQRGLLERITNDAYMKFQKPDIFRRATEVLQMLH